MGKVKTAEKEKENSISQDRPQRVKQFVPRKTLSVFHEGFLFHKNKKHTDVHGRTKEYLICKLKGCSGKGTLDEEGNFNQTCKHNMHLVSKTYEAEAKFRMEAFAKLNSTASTSRQIFNECSEANPEAAEMVSYDSLKRTLKYWRQVDRPQLPKRLNEVSAILNTPAWQKLLTFDVRKNGNKETHVLDVHDISVDDGTIIIFVDRQFTKKFEEATDFFADATFDTIPNVKGTYQLLSIMAERFGKIFPFVWALMNRKTSSSYVAVFQFVKEKILPNMDPVKFVSDFETAIHNAVRNVFHNAEVQGCFFHFVYSIRKQAIKMHIPASLKRMTKEQARKGRLLLRKLMNVCLLPPVYINTAYGLLLEELKADSTLTAPLLTLFHYFERQWLTKVTPNVFSVYHSHNRTNNGQERYHRFLKESLGVRSELNKFLGGLIKVIKLHYTEFRRLQRGKCKNKSNVKSTNKGIDKWLHDAWEQLEIINVLTPRQQNLKILDFLEQSVHQFSEIFGNIKTLVYDDTTDTDVGDIKWIPANCIISKGPTKGTILLDAKIFSI